ncbi:hypothetical protein EWM64_g7445 [Hericium alpestre]|uniref:Uncharacterized protein n=1 Tax=Hericium alpestre TaxID=135208 RepID=A0A4Y9ZSV8_9AGAM|nr:hypothetical protein EWM64_g7445 [Hericium alpestre]
MVERRRLSCLQIPLCGTSGRQRSSTSGLSESCPALALSGSSPAHPLASATSSLSSSQTETLELEVTAPSDELHAIAKKAVAIYGHVDVLVNNAGFFVGGAIEEFTPQETYDQFNTNLFGPLNVARAFLPYMRARRAGMIAWVGSLASWVPIVNLGVYGSTKIAMRLFSMTLNDEITPFGLRSILFEPGYFRTPFIAPGRSDVSTNRINDYREMCGRAEAALQAVDGNQLGDPEKGAQVMVDFIRGEGQAAGKNVPTVIHLGSDTVRDAARVCNETLQRIDEWGGFRLYRFSRRS